MSDPYKTLQTRLVHAGTPHPRVRGAVITPIFQSANYEQADPESYAAVTYARLNNTPNHLALGRKIAAVEGTEAATVAASGMAAITAALLSILGSGDHLLVQQTVYGGTQTFLSTDAKRLGIDHTPIDPRKPDTWEAALTERTRAIYVEGLSNPLLGVADLPAILHFAQRHDLVSFIDNTFLSPILFRPAELGFDLVLHSATKYLNGHSDVVAGAAAGSAARIDAVIHQLSHFGGSLDPHACFLLERGMKTLGLRMAYQTRAADRVARALQAHPAVTQVIYPGLPDHPDHALAAALFDGFGAMISLRLRDGDLGSRFVDAVRIPVHAASLGGVESLVVQPARSTHLGVPAAAREAGGITDDLVRISVGIEDTDELIADLLRALDAATSMS